MNNSYVPPILFLRMALARQKAALDDERQQLLAQMERERLAIEARRMEACQRESAAERAEREVIRKQGGE